MEAPSQVTQAERLRQLTPAVRSLDSQFAAAATSQTPPALEPILPSDRESVKTTHRPRSQADQSETVKRRKTKKDAGAHRERRAPDGVTGDDTAAETAGEMGPGSASEAVAQAKMRKPTARKDPYASQTDDQASLMSYESTMSRRSGRSVTSSLGEDVARQLDLFRHQMLSVYASRGYSKHRQESAAQRVTDRMQSCLEEVEEVAQERMRQLGRHDSHRPPARQKVDSRRNPVNQQSDHDYQIAQQTEDDRRMAERLQAEFNETAASDGAAPRQVGRTNFRFATASCKTTGKIASDVAGSSIGPGIHSTTTVRGRGGWRTWRR